MNSRPTIRRLKRWAKPTGLGFAGILTLLSLAPAAAQPVCPAGPAIVGFNLPHFRTALARPAELVIVTLGSSSTEGIAASDEAHSYPAVLQASLSAALPHAHVAVVNRGIGGQDAPEELSRLDHDVIAIRPVLVIWQVGANGAMRHSNPAEFQHLVTVGVRRMESAGIDVILMDNQRAPRVDASPEHAAMQAALAEVARQTGAALFSRTVLMDAWAQEGAPEGDFISSDGLHHNDLGYYCVATRLAATIIAGLAPLRPQTVSRQ